MMIFNIDNHLKHFPHAAIMEYEGRIAGLWQIGNNYRRKTPYYGAYPPSYIERVLSLFPDVQPENILHLFSGSVNEGGVTFDCNPDLNPDVCGDAETVSDYFMPDDFELALIDPPYTKTDAKIYGYKMPRMNIVLRSLHAVVRKGGMAVVLSTKPPMFQKILWRWAGTIGLHTGTNRVFRAVTFLERL